MLSRTTIMATAIPVPHQVDRTLALHHHPPITLAVNTAAALRVTQTIRPLLDSRMARGMEVARDMEAARGMEVTAHNNTRHSRSRGTVMVLRLVSVDSLVMVDQLLTTAKDHRLQALVVTVNKPDTEVLHTAALLAHTAVQGTTITTNITNMAGPQHIKTNTEANSTLHHRVMQVATAVRRDTTHLSLAGSRYREIEV